MAWLTPEVIAALLGAGGVGALLNYLLGRRKVDTEHVLGQQRLSLEERSLVYTHQTAEITRLQVRSEQLEKKADECEERERALGQRVTALRTEIDNLKGDMRALVHRTMAAVVTCDATGMILSWNTAAEHLFGWGREDVEMKENIHILIPREDREEHDRAFLRAVDKPEFQEVVLRRAEALHRDSTRIPVTIRLTRRQNAACEVFFTAEITMR